MSTCKEGFKQYTNIYAEIIHCLPLLLESMSSVAAATFSKGLPCTSGGLGDTFSPSKQQIFIIMIYRNVIVPFNKGVLSSLTSCTLGFKSSYFTLRLR